MLKKICFLVGLEWVFGDDELMVRFGDDWGCERGGWILEAGM